jgi:hypothetical protein
MPVRNIRLERQSMSGGLFCFSVSTVWRPDLRDVALHLLLCRKEGVKAGRNVGR